MTYAERLPKTSIPAAALRRIVEAVWRFGGSAASAGPARRRPGRGLDAGTLRDIGARREYQDYASSAAVNARPDRCLWGRLSRP